MLLVDATTAEHARGIGTVIAGVLDGLAEQPEPAVVTAGPSLPPEPGVSWRSIELASTRPGRLLYQRLLLPFAARRIREPEQVDRILMLDAYAPVARPFRGMRYAALVHDVLPLSHPEYWPRSKRLVKRVAFSSLRRGVTLFTSTQFNANEIERLLGLEAHVVTFGCGQLTDAEAEAALTASLPERRPYVLFVGTFEPRKGVTSLVDAFEQLVEQGSDLHLVLAGNGPPTYRRLLDERVTRPSIRTRVRILHPRERGDVLDLIAHASALVLPTRAEGFGLPILEALALGTPAVASDIPAIRAWAEETAVYAPVGEPARLAESIGAATALTDDERRRRQEFTRGFRWSSCAADLTRF